MFCNDFLIKLSCKTGCILKLKWYRGSCLHHLTPLMLLIFSQFLMFIVFEREVLCPSLLSLTCCLLCLCTAEDIESVVHGLQLHGVHRVWWQRGNRAHHRVATELGEDWKSGEALGGRCDLVGAGPRLAAPLHRHTLWCHRKHRQSDAWEELEKGKKCAFIKKM